LSGAVADAFSTTGGPLQLYAAADIDHMTFDTPASIHAGSDGLYTPPRPGITKEC
jgi:hypothetical protein